VRSAVVGAIVCAMAGPWQIACADRDVTTNASGTSSSTGAVGSTGWTPVSGDSTAAEGATTAGSGAQDLYIDCRPIFYDPSPSAPYECTQTYGAFPSEHWSSFACNVCLCVESCEQSSDCIDRGAPVPPSCVSTAANPDFRLCALLCEDDGDCPGEMVCLPSMHLGDSACFLPWTKPACCESPEATGC